MAAAGRAFAGSVHVASSRAPKAYALSLKAVVPEGATNFGFLQDPTAVMKSIEKYKEPSELV